MINQLDNSEAKTAQQIFDVFQGSYRVEAVLLGVENFPPLARSAADIQCATSQFYGYFEHGELAAVAEITLSDQCVEIDSFTVSPSHFRKGIANKLLTDILKKHESLDAVVETAVANTPAIKLYEKHGFVEFKRWVPSHGIPKLAMRIA
ncbi:GNAT family N-acetyltransferase [Thalassotalea fusca]